MSTEELIEQLNLAEGVLRETLRGQVAALGAIRSELQVHRDLGTEMTTASQTARIDRVKAALTPFGVDTSTWTG